jgi:hypothetical protein
MRFYEIKPILREFVEPQTQLDLSAIDNIEQGLENNPDMAQELLPELQNILSFVKTKTQLQVPIRSPVVQPQAKPAVQPPPVPGKPLQTPEHDPNVIGATPKPEVVGEDATATMNAGDAALENALMMLQQLKALFPKMKLATDREKVDQAINNIEAQFSNVHQAGVEKGEQELLNKQAQWRSKELPDLSKKLTQKVLGFLQQLKQISDEAIAKGEESLENKKQEPKEDTIYRQIHDPLEALFAKLSDPTQGVTAEEYKANIDRVKDFMIRCQLGIFSMDDLVRRKVGNIRSLISKQDQEIYDIIYQKLLSITVSGSGSWGPGEVGLAVLGKPVNKIKGKGDLVVGEKKIPIELKSGKKATAGARLGGDAVQQAKGAQKGFVNYLTTFVNGVLGKDNDAFVYGGKDSRPQWTWEVEQTKPVTKNKIKSKVGTGEFTTNKLFATNMSSPEWFEQFNTKVLAKINPKKRPESAKTFLTNVMRISLTGKGEAPFEEAIAQFNSAANMLDSQGYIVYEKFLRELTRVWYYIYSEVDNFKFILVLNQSNGNFELVKNIDGMVSNIGTPREKGNLKGIEITGGLDFGAGQIQLSPQVGIY